MDRWKVRRDYRPVTDGHPRHAPEIAFPSCVGRMMRPMADQNFSGAPLDGDAGYEDTGEVYELAARGGGPVRGPDRAARPGDPGRPGSPRGAVPRARWRLPRVGLGVRWRELVEEANRAANEAGRPELMGDPGWLRACHEGLIRARDGFEPKRDGNDQLRAEIINGAGGLGSRALPF